MYSEDDAIKVYDYSFEFNRTSYIKLTTYTLLVHLKLTTYTLLVHLKLIVYSLYSSCICDRLYINHPFTAFSRITLFIMSASAIYVDCNGIF